MKWSDKAPNLRQLVTPDSCKMCGHRDWDECNLYDDLSFFDQDNTDESMKYALICDSFARWDDDMFGIFVNDEE